MRKSWLTLLASFLFAVVLFYMLHVSVMLFAAPSSNKVVREMQQSGDNVYYFPVMFSEYQPPTWEYIGLNGDVTDVVFDPEDPNHVFASVYLGGFFETYDSGIFWTKHEQFTLTTRINDIEIHPITDTKMYLGTWGGYSVYWKDKGNDLWQPVPGSNFLYPTIYSIAVHPLTPTIMFAGSGNWESNGGEIYKTDNAGETWYPVSPMYTNALTFAFDPISPTVVYAGTQLRGIYKSVDGGATWNTANTGLPMIDPIDADYIASFVLYPENPLWLYVATSVGVFVSYDGAESWQPLFENIDANVLLFNINDFSTLYLGTNDGIYVSHNTGLSWVRLGQCGQGVDVNHLVFKPSNSSRLWAATNNGLWQCIIY